jgi:hypothetical protein
LRGRDATKTAPDHNDMGQVIQDRIVFLRLAVRPPVKQPIEGEYAAARDHEHQKQKQHGQPVVRRHGDTCHWNHHRDEQRGKPRRTAKQQRQRERRRTPRWMDKRCRSGSQHPFLQPRTNW